MKLKYIDEDDRVLWFNSEDKLLKYVNRLYNFSNRIPKTKNAAIKLLESGGTYLIKFKKVSDGSTRLMIGTRDWNKLSKDSNTGYVSSTGGSGKLVSPFQVIVWDLENQGFRSFRISNLISIDKISSDLVADYNPKLNMVKSKFIEMLDNGEVTISYTKADGSTRLMKCTRNINNFEDDNTLGTIRVWDLDKNDYRNIIFSKINKIVSKKLNRKYRIKNLFK